MPFENEMKELERRREKALAMGGPEKIKRQHDKGKGTARERIAGLLDPGSFFEVGLLNTSDIPGGKNPGGQQDRRIRQDRWPNRGDRRQ
jgi:acetyl-CoA carboxylase carboxyltransferase component